MSPEVLTGARDGVPAGTPVTFRPAALPPTASRDTEAEQVRSSGYAAGYAAGYSAGARAAARDAQEQHRRLAEEHARAEAVRDAVVGKALGLLEAAAAAARDRTTPVLEDARGTLHAAAFALAEAVLGRELSGGEDTGAARPGGAQDAAGATGSARVVLDRILAVPVDLGVHTVRLHPADHAHVQAVLARSDVGHALPAGVELVADASLAPGDVVSEYPDGWLDARIGSALDRARRALEEAGR